MASIFRLAQVLRAVLTQPWGRAGDRIVLVLLVCAFGLFVLKPWVVGSNEHDSYYPTCQNHLKSIGAAMMVYAEMHDGRFPPASRWCEAIAPHLNSLAIFRCPDSPGVPCAYAFNSLMSGVVLDRLAAPWTVVLAFDATGTWDSAGGSELASPRHAFDLGLVNVLFADGHVRGYPKAALQSLEWKPGYDKAVGAPGSVNSRAKPYARKVKRPTGHSLILQP